MLVPGPLCHILVVSGDLGCRIAKNTLSSVRVWMVRTGRLVENTVPLAEFRQQPALELRPIVADKLTWYSRKSIRFPVCHTQCAQSRPAMDIA